MGSLSDHDLMELVQAGDLDALGTLYGRHHRQVHALCYRLTGDAAAAEDLLHESFLRVLRYRGSFDGRSKFTTWLYRLVRNRCLDHLQAQRRDTKNLELLAGDEAATPQEQDHSDERRALLQAALERLSPEKREVLVLSRFENLKYREIASVCGLSLENVKVRAHRAMRELRRILEEMERET